MNNKNYLYYSELNEKDFNEAVKTYITQKDYANLRIALSAQRHDLQPLKTSIFYFDQEALSIVLENTDMDSRYMTNAFYWADTKNLEDFNEAKIINKSLSEFIPEKNLIVKQLVDFRLNARLKENADIIQHDIHLLYNILSDDEISEYIEKYNIKITDPSEIFLFNDSTAISSELNNDDKLSVILSRSYVKPGTNQDNITIAYKNLQKIPDIDKMLSFITSKIISGNSLKILFDSNIASGYHYCKNYVTISLTIEGDMTLESTIGHELTHFTMDNYFNNMLCPYPKSNLTLDEFRIASSQPLKFALSLITMHQTTNAPNACNFITAEQYSKYLTHNSILPFFHLLNRDHISNESLELSINNILKSDIILNHHDQIKSLLSKLDNYNTDYIAKQFTTELLPEIVKELSLSECSVFFLERVANNIYSPEYIKDSEYIAQYNEFLILSHQKEELYTEIINHYSELEEFSHQYLNFSGDSTSLEYDML